MKTEKKLISTEHVNILSMVVMLILVILQFTSYWSFDGQTSSINGYVWFPSSHTELVSYLEANVGTVEINDVIVMPIWTLLLATVGIICCIAYNSIPVTSAVSVVFGIIGLWGYLSCPVFRLSSFWGLHIVLCIAAILIGIVGIIPFVKEAAGEMKALTEH